MGENTEKSLIYSNLSSHCIKHA